MSQLSLSALSKPPLSCLLALSQLSLELSFSFFTKENIALFLTFYRGKHGPIHDFLQSKTYTIGWTTYGHAQLYDIISLLWGVWLAQSVQLAPGHLGPRVTVESLPGTLGNTGEHWETHGTHWGTLGTTGKHWETLGNTGTYEEHWGTLGHTREH